MQECRARTLFIGSYVLLEGLCMDESDKRISSDANDYESKARFVFFSCCISVMTQFLRGYRKIGMACG